MSNVRVQYGSATVELESRDYGFADFTVAQHYQPSDAVHALLQVLRSLDTDWAAKAVEGIQDGLDNMGCEL